ncbi:GDP-fucose protein O-fucosyltransferase 2 [Hondaea fermentalgiana]|uniref:GDP-fucose protein O-fucosyltransferase 2 n=1 Tax=Hondaea fermentalgiana TaxID=2315210 RepID=A0A2R5GLZ7_9STRA|nr:GDP-fucose protein O-fucosyltransferase 2 [Hondaea fermentalgiana]|eukprot:GBG31907.1 GDP-fucose protein O-fucosyltransferase 2 [Hondaea fermentalgiana]
MAVSSVGRRAVTAQNHELSQEQQLQQPLTAAAASVSGLGASGGWGGSMGSFTHANAPSVRSRRNIQSFMGRQSAFDVLAETAELTSPREAWALSSKGGWDPSASWRNFTTLNSHLQDVGRSTEYEPVELSAEELASREIQHFLLFYTVESLELPVYREITSSVQLGAPATLQPEFVRFVHRGDKVLGLQTEMIKKTNYFWLKLGPREYVPIHSRVVGRGGTIVHLRLDMKITSDRVMNERVYDDMRRDCAWVRDLSARNSCFRMMHLITELRRVLSESGLLRLRRIGTQEIVASAATHSFDDMMGMLLPAKSDREVCYSINSWAACTQRPLCTWFFNATRQESGCVLDQDIAYPVLPKTLPQYNASLDFPLPMEPERTPIDPNERFFLYQPSGGINNQRIQLETALVICLLLDRTCVLPPVAQHTNFFFRYNMHHPRRMVSMQRIFNIPRLLEVVKVRTIPEGHTLMSWIDAIGGTPYIGTPTGLSSNTSETGWRVVMRDARKMVSSFIWRDNDIKKIFAKDESRFLFFANASMWRTIDLMMLSPQYLAIKAHLTFTDTLKKQAIVFANSLGGSYNAIHVRRGDKRHEATFDEVARDPNYFGTRFLKYLPETTKMYVASDERNRSYFDPLVEMGYEVITYKDFDQELLKAFLTRYPPTMYFDMLGIIEQLVCSYAYKFMGSPYSTFTLYILRLRRRFPLLSQTFDDPPQLPAIYDGVDIEIDPEVACNPYDPQRHTKPC